MGGGMREKMRNRFKISKKALRMFLVGIACCAACLAGTGTRARAAEYSFGFAADVTVSGQETYDVRLTVENWGEDWEGTARLAVQESNYRQPVIYDTTLSLPRGSTKQFVVRVPVESVASEDSIVKVLLLDKKFNKVSEKEFKRLLAQGADALSMGILSDEYSSLTYLDMGGEEIYFQGENYPIRLVELNRDNLSDLLDSLTFLVIDGYDTGVLTDENLKDVELWTDAGGVLIVGTGDHAEETLRGLDYLGIRCVEVQEPEEYGESGGEGIGEGIGDGADYGIDYGMDVSSLHVAQLVDVNGSFTYYGYTHALLCSMRKGAVGVLPYSLSELGGLDESADQKYTRKQFVWDVLNDASGHASSRYNYTTSGYRDSSYMMRMALGVLGNGASRLSFGILKVIVILYVIFAGPVLYLILRFMKKRELYWGAVPAAALVGVFLVFLAGRGFEVVSTRAYSVTVEDLADQGSATTYLHCYDADRGEWGLRLADGYAYAGPMKNTYYGYSDGDKYFYRVRKEGDRIFLGVDAPHNFEDAYFLAGGRERSAAGSLVADGLWKVGMWNLAGNVTNGTDRDFKYFAVIFDNQLYLYKNLPAGETCDLSMMKTIYDGNNGSAVANLYLYGYLDDEVRNNNKDADVLAALGMGICTAYSEEFSYRTVVIGVTEDWDKVLDDNCSETSYGCLYMIQ